MKQPKTFEDLIEKYPKIFELMNDGYYRISSDIPTQWIYIVDQLCYSMQNRIDNVTIYGGEFKMTVPPQIVCEQVKEKYGGLRFYTHGGDKEMEGMISMAEDMCWNTCEECGSHENLGTTTGYMIRKCEICANKVSNNLKWKKDE